eukprot:3532517-Lingulodinium_polyedra.AAC.1
MLHVAVEHCNLPHRAGLRRGGHRRRLSVRGAQLVQRLHARPKPLLGRPLAANAPPLGLRGAHGLRAQEER